jgi:membrane-bound ClpP family serine protease
MIVLGVILLVLGYFLSVSILWTIGIILIVLGAILWVIDRARGAGGSAGWWYL